MGTILRSHTFTSGEILTAANLNGEFDVILSTVNGSIDAANVDTSVISTLTGTQTLTNKTLTSPKIGTNILDTNGNELFTLTATGSAVNEITLANAATGNSPTLTASGGDTNVSLTLAGKGSGKVIVTGDLQISGDDLFMATNTAGHLLIGDGTNYNPTALSGDVTVSSGGVAAIGTGVIVNADVNASAAIAQSKLSLAITTSQMAAATLVIASEGIGSNNNDTTIPTSGAVKTYVDANITAQDFDFSTTSGSGAVDLDSQVLAFTPGEGINITHSGQAVTFAAEDATAANKGVASFSSDDFSVSSGAVTLADLTTAHLAAATLVIESEGISSNDNDTTLPTSAAVKDYVDTNVTAQDLDFSTSSGNGAVDLDSQALAFTSGEGVDITHSGQAVTIAGEDATTSNKGIASFVSADFSVSSGAVSLVDLTVSHLAAATLVIESEGIGSNDNDTTLPTSAAVKDYVDTQILTEDTIAELNDTDIGTLAAGNLLIYDGSNSWDNKVVSGDISIGSDGAVAIGSGVIVNADVNASAAIVDTKLATISTGNKVSGSAVQLASTSAVENSTGLRVKSAIAGTGLSLASQVLSVDTSQTQITAVGTIATGVWAATDVAVAHGGTGASTASAARTGLGVAIGSNVQAYDAGLASIAGLTTAADKMIYTSGSNTYAVANLSSFARTILDDADASAVRATIGAGSSSASAFTDLSDVGATTPTAGRLMVADGDSWESREIDGDIALASDGAMTIQANSVAMGTDTTGNYVATVADAGNSHITVANSGAESAAVTLNIADNAVGIAQMAGLVRGKLIVGDSSGNPSLLTVGNNGQVLTSNASGDAVWGAVGASAFTDLTDVGATTPTGGRLMVADGDSWESVEIDGDIALASDGAMTIQANSVAMGTDTTGNYVATVADAGNSHITVANSGAETAAVTLNITNNAVGLAQMAGLARGKIIVGDSSGDPSALAAGSEDEILTINGSGDAVWAANEGAGATNMYVNGGAWAVKVASSTTWSFGWWQAGDDSWWLLGNTESADATFTRAQAEFYIPIGDINDVPTS